MTGGFASALAARWRTTITAALLLAAAGAVTFAQMPRDEDPSLSDRFGLVVAAYPGADVARVERLVVRPVEEALAEVTAVRDVTFTVRRGVGVARVRLRDDVGDLATAWTEVGDALDDAHRELPPEAPRPTLTHDLLRTESVVLAVAGLRDPLALVEAAEPLRRRLMALPEVGQVVRTGDPGAQVAVAVDDARLRDLGLPLAAVQGALVGRNATLPGGSLPIDGRAVTLRPATDFDGVQDVAATAVPLPGGGSVPLGQIAQVRREEATPAAERARLDGAPIVALGVVPRRGIDAIRFGDRVREVVAQFAAGAPELVVSEIAFQPGKVAARLSELGESLLWGVLIVALVVTVWMGLRLGLVVAAVVPLVASASVAVYGLAGGVLHQMAVAALVIALGLLVDNAIVMAEAIQRGRDLGLDAQAAARAALAELGAPLAAATGTTLASFLPMALAVGPTAEFTAAIPQVVAIALILSYLFAMVVTPALATLGLRPTHRPAAPHPLQAEQPRPSPRARWGAALTRFPIRHPFLTLGLALAALGAAGSAIRQARFDFFPASDREQIVVSLERAEGTDLDATDASAARLEAWLGARADVRSVATFVGRSTPFFYYNLPREPQSPHLAQLLVTTPDATSARALVDAIRREAGAVVPEALVVARRLEQGPPVAAPVQIRLFSEHPADLRAAADTLRAALAAIPGTAHIRDDQGAGAPTLTFAVVDASAARAGVSRQAVAAALRSRSDGLPTTQFRAGRTPEPVVVRGPAGRALAPATLAAIDVATPTGPVPLGSVARTALEFQPAVIHRRDGRRTISVLAEVVAPTTHAQVVGSLAPILAAAALPQSVTWTWGGATESSAEANAALGSKGPAGAIALVGLLLWQFNSFRRVLIILLTAPLAVLGIWPGLVLAGEPFGFMALLGSIALIGVVVNGAIVLIDRADRSRAAGATLEAALVDALRVRTRPILLTTATTVAGLLPLLFSASTLWPALAAAMISGLTIGTLLTLLVVPALYRLLLPDPRPPAPGLAPGLALGSAPASGTLGAAAAVALTLALLTAASPVQAVPGPGSEGDRPAREPLDHTAFGATAGGLTPAAIAQLAARAAPGVARARAAAAAARAGVDALSIAQAPSLRLTARYTRLSPQTNDPLVPAVGAADLQAARALVGQVGDPASRALLGASVEAQAGLGGARVPVFVDQLALGATALYPLTTALLQLAPRERRAALEAEAAEAQAEAEANQAALRALGALYGAMEAHAFGVLAARRETWAEAHRAERAADFAAGAATEADLRSAEMRVAAARLGRIEAAAAEATARDALVTLTNGAVPYDLTWVTPPLEPLPVGLPIARWLEEARRTRPEVRALERLLRAAEADLDAETGHLWPELTLVAHLDAANPNPRYVPQRARFDATWDVGAVLSWSPDGFLSARARARQAEAGAHRVRAERAAFEQALRADLTSAAHACAAAHARLDQIAALEAAADAALTARTALAAAGLARPSEPLDAEAERAAAQTERVRAAVAVWRAQAQLRFARGLTIAPEVGLGVDGEATVHPQ